MYRNAYQRGLLTVFFSGGQKPLDIWEMCVKDGYITSFLDDEIKTMVLQIGGTNISTTYITCPKGKMVLGITMPFLVMVVKNLKKYFSFEVTILDDSNTRRRFRVSNFQSTTQILPMCTVMPIGLSDGWNQIQFNLAEFTRRAYKKQFIEVQRIKVNANIRLRRIYFAERLLPEEELPAEYKLFFPLANKKKSAKGKENVSQQTATEAPSGERKGSKADVPIGSKSTEQTAKRPSQEGTVPKIEEVPPAQEKSQGQEVPVAAPDQIQAPAEGVQPAEAAVKGEPVAPDETAASEPAAAEASEPATEVEATQADAEPPPQEAEAVPATESAPE